MASTGQRILGSKMGSARIAVDIPRLVALYREGRLKLDELITRRYSIEQAVQAFDDLDAPVTRVTDVDVPLPYAANLEKMALIKPEDVIKAAKEVCYR